MTEEITYIVHKLEVTMEDRNAVLRVKGSDRTFDNSITRVVPADVTLAPGDEVAVTIQWPTPAPAPAA